MTAISRIFGFLGCIFLGSHNPVHYMDDLGDGSFASYTACSRCGKEKARV